MGISEKLWVNLLGFEIYWWLAIVYGQRALPALFIMLMLHFYYHSTPKAEFIKVLLIAAIGFEVDTLLTYLGWFEFPNSPNAIPPFWLFMLWAGFATMLTTCFCKFPQSTWLQALLGAAGGAASYLGAAALGAVQLPHSVFISGVVIAIIWALLLPIFLGLVRSLRRSYHEKHMV